MNFLEHIQSLVAASPEIRAEVVKFRDAFSLMYDKKDKVLCLFERNYKSSHLQIQLGRARVLSIILHEYACF